MISSRFGQKPVLMISLFVALLDTCSIFASTFPIYCTIRFALALSLAAVYSNSLVLHKFDLVLLTWFCQVLNTCLENPMDGGAWWAAVCGVAKSRIQLSNFTFTFHFHGLEKEMATHSSVLAWRIPGTGEPGRLPSLGSHRVGHN